MRKTAMQLLIEDIEKNDAYFMEFGTPDSPVKRIHAKATELLETEREQIEEAFKQSRKRISILGESEIQMTDYLIQAKFQDAKQYYKDTYQ